VLSIMKFLRRPLTIPHDELVNKVRRLENADLLALLLESEDRLSHLEETLSKYDQVLRTAERRYCQCPDWVTFFREVLGVEGVVRKAFPTFDELTAFEQSEQYEKIQRFLVKLREKRPSADTDSEPTRVISVRLPKSMHESLRTEAHDLRTSMNKLCISKLLQVIGEEMIPNERASNALSFRFESSRRSDDSIEHAKTKSRKPR
jgi:predicted HicB family RNase H-like nuclease